MSKVKEIVEVNITRDTRGVSRQGFGTPVFIGDTSGVLSTSNRIDTYASAEELLTAGFAETDPEYIAALRFFSQEVQPTFIKIGFHDTSGTETITEAYQAIKDEDDDFYFVTSYSHTAADIEALSDVVESENRIYGASYSGADALDDQDSTDIGSVLQTKGNQRTFLFYASDDTEYPECAIIGLQATKDPGSSTWKFKELSSVTVSNLTTSQSLTLRGSKFDPGKGYNTYERVGGRNIFREGRMVGGEFIDVIRLVDWTEARMRELIYLRLVNAEKIPYTAEGFAVIGGAIREILQRGQQLGGYATYSVIVPNPLDIDLNSRANRVASGFQFTARLASAIHFVEVSGNVTV